MTEKYCTFEWEPKVKKKDTFIKGGGGSANHLFHGKSKINGEFLTDTHALYLYTDKYTPTIGKAAQKYLKGSTSKMDDGLDRMVSRIVEEVYKNCDEHGDKRYAFFTELKVRTADGKEYAVFYHVYHHEPYDGPHYEFSLVQWRYVEQFFAGYKGGRISFYYTDYTYVKEGSTPFSLAPLGVVCDGKVVGILTPIRDMTFRIMPEVREAIAEYWHEKVA